MNNYRPVTVPSGFSKIFEYSFLDRLTSFLKKWNILTDNQYGFRNGKSTQSAIYALYEQVVSYMEAGECPAGIFCDLSKAFDCVDIDLLLMKLSIYGIRGIAWDWVHSFLVMRSQFVSIVKTNNDGSCRTQSERATIDIGVPQGSVLGPVLFILFTNDIETVTRDANFVMYADDKSLIVSEVHDDLLEMKCNKVLDDISEWYSSNKLYFNISKTNFMRFHNRQKNCSDLSLKINDIDLQNEESLQFLGITIDDCLTWKQHCKLLISKLHSSCYLFRNLRPILSEAQLLSLYHAQVGSRIRYGICLWGTSTSSADVFIAQKRVIRSLAKISKRVSCKSFFKKWNILTVASLYIYEICVYIYSNQRKFKMNKSIHNFNTRLKSDYHVPVCKTNVVYKSPNNIGLKIFNKLPTNIKISSTLYSFKKNLKIFLTDNCFYSVSEFFDT